MKRLILIVAALLMLTGCSRHVDLMPDASPETSALALYVYDGETITRQFLFETENIRDEVLKDFRQAAAKPAEVDVTTLRPPFYGLEIGGTEEGTVHGLWADGYFITGDGSVYGLDYAFETLLAAQPWEEPDVFSSLSVMPCASYVAKTGAGWNRNFLTVAEDPQWPDGITLELVEQDQNTVMVRFDNQSGSEWGHGYDFRLDVLLDDQWYQIPSEQELSFQEVYVILPDQVDHIQIYDLSYYGDLPAGTYRLVTGDGPWVTLALGSKG